MSDVDSNKVTIIVEKRLTFSLGHVFSRIPEQDHLHREQEILLAGLVTSDQRPGIFKVDPIMNDQIFRRGRVDPVHRPEFSSGFINDVIDPHLLPVSARRTDRCADIRLFCQATGRLCAESRSCCRD